MKPVIKSTWDPEKCILTTKLKGSISLDDVKDWKQELLATIQIVDRPFKFLFDNYNFNAASMDVHRAYRDFVPRLLARHGLIVSLLTDEDKLIIAEEHDAKLPTCKAMALVHHYQYKMQKLDDEYKKGNQRYFYNCSAAENWINSYPVDCRS